MRDWKKDLSKVASKGGPKHGVAKLIQGYSRIHPENMFAKLGKVFDSVSVKHVGGWPDYSVPPLVNPMPDQLGDEILVATVRDGEVLLKTNKGFFRFYNS